MSGSAALLLRLAGDTDAVERIRLRLQQIDGGVIDPGRVRSALLAAADDLTFRPGSTGEYPPGDPGKLQVRCAPDHAHGDSCGQDEIGDWWQGEARR